MELEERIIAEASNLFFRRGIRSVTMSEIANHLGISKRTLYEIVPDKESLIEQCLHFELKREQVAFTELIAESTTVIDALVRVYSKHLISLNQMNKSLIHDLKKYHPKQYQKVEERQNAGFTEFAPLFARGLEQGLLRDDIPFELLFWTFQVQMKAILENDNIPYAAFSIQEILEAIVLNFVRGIASSKGNELIDKLVHK